MKQMKQRTKFKLLHIAFTYVLPIIFISTKYSLFSKGGNPKVKLSAVGALILVFLIIRCYKGLEGIINKIEKPQVRKTFRIARNLVICLIIVLILEMTKKNIDNLEFCIMSCGISMCVGSWFYEDYIECVKADEKEKRQNEIIEAFEKSQKK